MFVHQRMLLAKDEAKFTAEDLAGRLTPFFEKQQGFQSCLIGKDGASWKIMSIWRSEQNYLDFDASEERARITETLAASGFIAGDENQYSEMASIEPHIGELRLIQATVLPEEIDRIKDYWLEAGQKLNETAPGCVRADAFVHSAESQLHFVVWWRSEEDAKHFRYTDHLDGELARNFSPGMRSFARYSLAHVTK